MPIKPPGKSNLACQKCGHILTTKTSNTHKNRHQKANLSKMQIRKNHTNSLLKNGVTMAINNEKDTWKSPKGRTGDH